MVNLACVTRGSFVWDPFVGTGSLILAAAALGGTTWGTDIDYRVVVLGKAGANVFTNFADRRLPHPELLRCDSSASALVPHRPFFDAIVADPPYGVRAGARRSGRKGGPRHEGEAENDGAVPAGAHICGGCPAGDPGGDGKAAVHEATSFSHVPHGPLLRGPLGNIVRGRHYIPATQPYDGEEVVIDLLEAAARTLVLGGRLCYLYPCLPAEYAETVLPRHPCLRLICDPEERLGHMLSRRLVTMEKVAAWHGPHAAQAYRVDAVAAAVAAGTAGAGGSLRERMGRALDEWYSETKSDEAALREAARGARRGKVNSSMSDTSESCAPPLSSPLSSASPLEAYAALGRGGTSRAASKLELRKLRRQDKRLERLQPLATAAGGGVAAGTEVADVGLEASGEATPRARNASRQGQQLRRGQQANLLYREKVAAGIVPLPNGQAPFSKPARQEPG
jgi:tRNA (guanine10-N2)-methyltransferase